MADLEAFVAELRRFVAARGNLFLLASGPTAIAGFLAFFLPNRPSAGSTGPRFE